MKNFDLEAAKRGAAVCTRDGGYARIITFDGEATVYNIPQPIIACFKESDGDIAVSAFGADGAYSYELGSELDLMMRDDDYLEKLERGEYDHIADGSKKLGPVIKHNLTTDREYWRRVYAGQAMQGIFAGRNWRSGEMIPDCTGFARNAVLFADALIEELEKTEE